MKNQNSHHVERLIYEMQLLNYSSKTVNSYSSLLSKIESFYDLAFDQISTQQFKDYVLRRITSEEISTSMINQTLVSIKTTSGYLHLVNVNLSSVVSPLDSMKV